MATSRDIALSELPIRGISINTLLGVDDTHTLVGSDSGVMFVNYYNATTTYTLPAVVEGAGKMFWFYDAVGNDILITSPTATRLYGPTALGTTCTGTGAIGNCCMVVGDGTYYYVFAFTDNWAVA